MGVEKGSIRLVGGREGIIVVVTRQAVRGVFRNRILKGGPANTT